MVKKIPLGATRVLTLGSPNKSSDSTTMYALAKNLDTGTTIGIGSTDGAEAGTNVNISCAFTTANGCAVGDRYSIQANNTLDRFAPNDKEPDAIIVEIIEMLAE